jgi:hypothetical protein
MLREEKQTRTREWEENRVYSRFILIKTKLEDWVKSLRSDFTSAELLLSALHFKLRSFFALNTHA